MVEAPYIAVLRAGLSRCCRLRADLERELADMTETTAAVPDDEHDAEGSTIGYERARVTALLARVRQEIDDLTDALARATGSPDAAGSPYGRCRTCGGSIGEDRLAALPAAVTCMDCADPSGPGRFRLVR